MQKPRQESDTFLESDPVFDYRSPEDRARLLSGPKFDEVLLIEPKKEMLAEVLLLRRAIFRDVMTKCALTKEMAADTLGVSLPTVIAWLRPEHQRASRPVPAWAMEMLAYKTGVRAFAPDHEARMGVGRNYAVAPPQPLPPLPRRRKSLEELAWLRLQKQRRQALQQEKQRRAAERGTEQS